MRDLKQAAIDVMLGIHLGDALGVPFENMTRQEILNATGGEGVSRPRFDFDPKSRKIPDTRGLASGATSDDSQLANATAEGLIMAGRYDHELHVLLHLKALWQDVAGWGGTTKRSLYEIDKHYRAQARRLPRRPPAFKKEKDRRTWEEAEPRDPMHQARWRENARGNGPSMKIAPLGLYYGLMGGGGFESGEALEEILQFSRMTHADPVCAIAAHAVAGVISDLLSDGPEVARARLMPRALAAESQLVFLHHGSERFTQALQTAIGLIVDPESLWEFGSASKSDSLTSVPMALAVWWRHSNDEEPTAAVLEAINAGGDTDTVAAMVGAMMGAAGRRAGWWPDAWRECLSDRGATAKHLGERLHDVATLRRLPEGFDLIDLKRQLGYA